MAWVISDKTEQPGYGEGVLFKTETYKEYKSHPAQVAYSNLDEGVDLGNPVDPPTAEAAAKVSFGFPGPRDPKMWRGTDK